MGSENKNNDKKKSSLLDKIALTIVGSTAVAIFAYASIESYKAFNIPKQSFTYSSNSINDFSRFHDEEACELIKYDHNKSYSKLKEQFNNGNTEILENVILKYIQNNGYQIDQERVLKFKEDQIKFLKEGIANGKVSERDYKASNEFLENMVEDSRKEISSTIDPNFREVGYQGTEDNRTYSLGNNNINIKKNAENVEVIVNAYGENFNYTLKDNDFDNAVSNILNTFEMANKVYTGIVGKNVVVCKEEGEVKFHTPKGYRTVYAAMDTLLPKTETKSPLNALTNETNHIYMGE
jgi:hypothetical protein